MEGDHTGRVKQLLEMQTAGVEANIEAHIADVKSETAEIKSELAEV
eukprot:SAG22_NODE_844_length_6872_cov_10.004577_6_plen_46_part_00